MAKVKQTAKVISQEKIAEGIYSMWIQTEGIAVNAKAGQFISVYCKDSTKLLPRPISICEINKETDALRIVYRVVGGGTEEFSHYQAGDDIVILGPLGNGFPIEQKAALFVAGGIGIPPMLEAAKTAKRMGIKNIKIVLGYRNQDTFLKEELEQYGEVYVATEDGSIGTKGNVLDAIAEHQLDLESEVIYSCGPMPMLKALKVFAVNNGIKCYVSLEERMACGIGACLACVCKSKDTDAHSHVHNKRVCADGPVFDAREIEF